jgi:hypothetical protein
MTFGSEGTALHERSLRSTLPLPADEGSKTRIILAEFLFQENNPHLTGKLPTWHRFQYLIKNLLLEMALQLQWISRRASMYPQHGSSDSSVHVPKMFNPLSSHLLLYWALSLWRAKTAGEVALRISHEKGWTSFKPSKDCLTPICDLLLSLHRWLLKLL